jgi:uncharacterized BrkB/YihY/UPF0761 family membrane protein
MRTAFNWIGGIVAIILAGASIYVALNKNFTCAQLSHDDLGKLIVGFWAVIPPIFFWIDWVVLYSRIADRDAAKHTHDLSRNIWLGLVGILAYAFFGKGLGG